MLEIDVEVLELLMAIWIVDLGATTLEAMMDQAGASERRVLERYVY